MIKFTTTTNKTYWLTVSQIEDMAAPNTIVFDGTSFETGIIIDDNITIWINPATKRVHIEELFINEDNEQEIDYLEIEYMTQKEVKELLDFEEVIYTYNKRLSA